MNLSAFPKIFTIGDRFTANLFNGPVEVTEKVDGSQFVFGVHEGELLIRSKGAKIQTDDPDNMFRDGVEYVKSIRERLPEGWTFYTEYLKKPKHNILAYANIPRNHLYLFGLSVGMQAFIQNADVLQEWANILEIEPPRILNFPDGMDGEGRVNAIGCLLSTVSILGGPTIEGIVVKNYLQSVMVGDVVIPILCGKFVSEKFKEKHATDWNKENTTKGKWDVYLQGFRTDARWLKAVQHLRDAGQLQESPQDIGPLLRTIKEDITEEEKETIKEWLWKEHSPQLLKNATVGFPEWYKEYLIKEAP